MLDKLTQREKNFVFGAAAIILLALIFILFQFIFNKRSKIRSEAAGITADIQKMIRLEKQIASLPAQQNLPDKNQLKSQIYNALEKNGLKGTIKDREESISRDEMLIIVDIDINGVTLNPVIDFLYDVEYGNLVSADIGKYSFRRPLPDRELYDVNISIYSKRSKR